MPRTIGKDVITLLGDDYGARTDGTYPDLTPYIATASAIVTRVLSCAVDKGKSLDAATAELLERWLAAHYYTKNDPVYASRSAGGASGSFVRDPKEPEPYKNVALDLDPSGCLAAIFNRQRASVDWLGVPARDQRAAWER